VIQVIRALKEHQVGATARIGAEHGVSDAASYACRWEENARLEKLPAESMLDVST